LHHLDSMLDAPISNLAKLIAVFNIKPSNIESGFDIRWYLDPILDGSITI
jgi:hypothetical protein